MRLEAGLCLGRVSHRIAIGTSLRAAVIGADVAALVAGASLAIALGLGDDGPAGDIAKPRCIDADGRARWPGQEMGLGAERGRYAGRRGKLGEPSKQRALLDLTGILPGTAYA